MKKKVFLLLLINIIFHNCIGQIKSNNSKSIDMKYFNEKYYNDWEIDTSFPIIPETKFLKKGNNKVKITKGDKVIQVELSSTINPYTYLYTYDIKQEIQLSNGKKFHKMEVGTWEYFDINGKLQKRIDADEGFSFSLNDLIKKMKKEYKIELLDSININISRGFFKNRRCYQISIPTTSEYEYDVYKIDGETGEILLSPNIKDEIQETSQTPKTTTFNGKTYTEEEWKAFEQEQWEKYQAKRNKKGFFDWLFG